MNAPMHGMAKAISEARHALDAGNYTNALTLLNQIIAAENAELNEPVAAMLGEAFRGLGFARESAEFYEKAAALDSGKAFENYRKAAIGYFGCKDDDNALVCAMKANHLTSGDAEIVFIMTTLLLKTNEANLVAHLRTALVESDDPRHLRLAARLIGSARPSPEALTVYRKLRRIDPNDVGTWTTLRNLARYYCDYEVLAEEEAFLSDAELVKRPDLMAFETPFLNMFWCADEAANRLAINAQSIDLDRPASPTAALHHHFGNKIRLGYLCSDFYSTHVTMRLIQDVLRRHDPARFEVTLFCATPPERIAADRGDRSGWGKTVSIAGLSDVEAAAVIKEHRTDILVDLKGHTENSRVTILNLRPAPIQVNWLAFPGSYVGIECDYIIGDPVITPDSARPHYHEKFCRLPDTYQPNDPVARALPEATDRANLGLPAEAFVFASFNGPQKMNPATVEAWVKILQGAPGSVLWMLSGGPLMEENVRKRMGADGIAHERLIFAPGVPYEQHLARMRAADLGLDPFIYNGHTTTSDKLWVGLPVLAVRGTSFASRVSESVLKAVGLPDLVASDRDDYVRLAIDLATDRAKTAALRQRLDDNRFRAPLFDSERFCHHLETAFAMMIDRARKGLRPDHIDVPALPPRQGSFG